MAVALALCAALVYGAADFFGGLASKKTSAAVVVVLAQLAGLPLLAGLALAGPQRFALSDVGWGVVAGCGGALGIGALYAALAVGRMGVISPITAVVGASVPVVAGFALGERPSPLATVGLGLAFCAVALVAANADTWRISLDEPGLGLALVSGAAIGLLYVALAHGHRDDALTVLATTRLTSIVLLTMFALRRGRSLRPAPGSVPVILAAGLLDMTANVLYVVATHMGMLAIVAVLTSLYPASTVVLARVVLGERLGRAQWAGVALAAAGVVLIAR